MKNAIRSLIVFAIGTLVLTSLSPFAVVGGGFVLPTSHIISDIPYHQQLTGIACGAGSLEMAFDYWGPDIDQREIADVARTSSSGTWTADIVRTGQFSYLSSAMGRFYPSSVPTAGFPERAIGYAAFGYSSDTFWLDDMKALIAQDIPVIVLMNYYPDGGGGHYRVVMGYDDATQLVYFIDTWGRDILHLCDWTGIISWTYSDFQMGWNYTEYGTAHPYWGAIVLPWTVTLSAKGKTSPGSTLTVTATITYPCPAPFDRTQFPASSAWAQLTLPEGLTVLGSDEMLIGDLGAGNSATVIWKVLCDEKATGKTLTVDAGGLISGSVPEAYWAGETVYYPAYDYTDIIGGYAELTL